jgi:hypothetical protein
VLRVACRSEIVTGIEMFHVKHPCADESPCPTASPAVTTRGIISPCAPRAFLGVRIARISTTEALSGLSHALSMCDASLVPPFVRLQEHVAPITFMIYILPFCY